MKRICMIGMVLLGISAASTRAADVLLTINVTSNAAQLGYTLNQPLTFEFVVNGDFASPESFFDTGVNSWNRNFLSTMTLFESITGTGLTGSYDGTSDPDSWVSTETGFFNIFVDTALPATSLGLSTPDSSAIRKIDVGFVAGPDWTFPDADITPGAYFPAFEGSLTLDSGDYFLLSRVGSATPYEFTITSASIGSVPEPSTWVLLGLGAVGFIGLRQFRRGQGAQG